MAVEAAQFHKSRLERHPEDYKPNIRKLLEEGLACPATYYAETKAHQHKLQEETQAMLADDTILLTPATLDPAPDAATTGNPAFNSPWSYTGMPTVSFPTGQFVDGLPLAIQLVGGRDSEVAASKGGAMVRTGVGSRTNDTATLIRLKLLLLSPHPLHPPNEIRAFFHEVRKADPKIKLIPMSF